MNNITYAVSVDVNNPIIPYNVYVASVLDSNVRYLEITLYQNGNVIALSDTATATASLVTDNVLVNDSVNCTIQDNIITVPLEDLQRHGNLDVQVTVTEGTKVLAIPFPIQVRVTPNIAENAQIDENSLGSYAEVVHEIAEARGTYTTLHDAIATKLDNAVNAVKTMHITDGAVTEEKLSFQTREKLNFVEEKAFKILDGTLSGDRSISPTLLVDSISDQTYNPDGDLILYYIDSEDVRHNIFNFTQVLCSNEAATEMIDTALSGDSYGMNMTLNLDNIVDQGANPDGHLMLYYIDSDWTRHNIFDFTPYLGTKNYNALQNRPVITGSDVSTSVATELEGYMNFSSDGFTVSTYQDPDKEIDVDLAASVPNCWTANYSAGHYDFNNITGTFARAGVFQIQYPRAANKPETINDIVGSCFIIHLVSPADNANMIRYIVGGNANGQIVTYMQTAELRKIRAFNYEVLYQLGWKKIGEKGDTGATGADGYSPTATVTQTQNGATVSITDKNGTTTADVLNGEDYILTAQDKSDIANIVLRLLPTTQGVQYGNTGN